MPTTNEWLRILKTPVSGVDELRDLVRKHIDTSIVEYKQGQRDMLEKVFRAWCDMLTMEFDTWLNSQLASEIEGSDDE